MGAVALALYGKGGSLELESYTEHGICRTVGSSLHCYLSLELYSNEKRREMKVIQATVQNKWNFSSNEN